MHFTEIDNCGKIVVQYKYDAWGNHKVLDADGKENTDTRFIGNVNPIRYRGYYYDRETGLYYLQSRYYDSVIGRFINADSASYINPTNFNELNLYCYCDNNPVMLIKGGASFGSEGTVSSSTLGGYGSGGRVQSVRVPEWMKIGVGTIPDVILGVKYLLTKGIHNKFVYSTDTLYIFPELGANWT